MEMIKIGVAADTLGVSTDTVRKWIDSDQLKAVRTSSGQREINPPDLAKFLKSNILNKERSDNTGEREIAISARNRFSGIITEVIVDGVMAQIEMVAGRFRVVSLMSKEAALELDLKPGVFATATVKATNITVNRSMSTKER